MPRPLNSWVKGLTRSMVIRTNLRLTVSDFSSTRFCKRRRRSRYSQTGRLWTKSSSALDNPSARIIIGVKRAANVRQRRERLRRIQVSLLRRFSTQHSAHRKVPTPSTKPNSRGEFMRMKSALLACLAAAVLTAMSGRAQQAVPPEHAMLPEMPKQTTRTGKRVNRVIDMWLKNQPVYYAQISGGGYEQGKELAATKADYITYEMEHGPLDFKELREFMRGLVEAGPTRTGHKTPAVIVTLPIAGTTDALRANAWMIQQALAAGVHGILLCNAERPEAARLMIEAWRYPFAPRG